MTWKKSCGTTAPSGKIRRITVGFTPDQFDYLEDLSFRTDKSIAEIVRNTCFGDIDLPKGDAP